MNNYGELTKNKNEHNLKQGNDKEFYKYLNELKVEESSNDSLFMEKDDYCACFMTF